MKLPLRIEAKTLVEGTAQGPVCASKDRLSFWGGFDPDTGRVIDQRHSLFGYTLTGTVFVLPHGKGSSTGSPVLLDALIQGTAPAAILLNQVDEIIALGGVVADEFFNKSIPILVLEDSDYCVVEQAAYIRIEHRGLLKVFRRGTSP